MSIESGSRPGRARARASLESSAGQINRPSLKRLLADRIRGMIMSRELPAGSRIDPDKLASYFGTSKLPVREALIALEAEALVHHIPNRGAFVASLTAEDLLDHFDIYGMAAGRAAGRAAERLGADELDDLSKLLEKMKTEESLEPFVELNERFHALINRAGSSARLRCILAQDIPIEFYEIIPEWRDMAITHNTRLLDALRRRDGAAASRLTIDTLRVSGELAVSNLITED
jgi:DNA-binding GntR family transcriptional regulator